MITLAWYLLKVIICSGILYGYYFLVMRNKVFHRWNRFYLLGAIIISLLAPIIKIDLLQKTEEKGAVVQMLQTISYGDETVIEYSRNNGFQIDTENMAIAAYLLVSVIFLFIFFVSLYKIRILRKKNPETKIEDIRFVNTNAKGTPFSFFKSIFWNKAIDLHSKSGQQIFNHEIAHVKEKHSYDKIFMNLILIFFWINPFFWLMRKELNMIHEFVADKEALEDSDLNAFAEMILQTVYPGQNFSVTNNFFYSPLKRRIMMLSKNKNPKVNYMSRLLVLPLAAIVFFAFTLKIHNTDQLNSYDGKTINVVIDAGHGGADNGAITEDGLKEKDITLAIAKEIAELNSNTHINILLTRNGDQTIPVKERVAFAKNNHADIFISLHVNAAADEELNGFSVLIDKKNSEKNLLLGSALINELKKSYQTDDKMGVRKNGVWILDQNVCPAALVECGFLSNTKDMAFITNKSDQQKIALNILNGIENYATTLQTKDDVSPIGNDTIPSNQPDSIPYAIFYKGKKLKTTQYIDKSAKVKATYYDGSTEIVTKEEALKRGFIPPPPPPGLSPAYFKSKALFVVDGKITTNKEAENINPDEIKSIHILKGEKAISEYGEKGKNGVIEISTKNEDAFNIYADTIHIQDFPRDKQEQNIKATGKSGVYFDNNIPPETLIIVDGKEIPTYEIKNIQPNKIESISILKGKSAQLKFGEKAKDGVIEIKLKPLDMLTPTGMSVDTIPGKIFTKVEKDASFPGGLSAWTRYISRKITDSIKEFTKTDYGTCVVRFIVNTEGTVSDVEATTMRGTMLAKVSVDAIRNGPKWIPASQNGHAVTSYRLQPVTLTSPDQKKPSAKSEPLTTGKENKEVFLKLEEPKVFLRLNQTASFPGGQSAWLRYLSRVFDKNGNALMSDKNNEGTCKVRFIVSKDGDVSDVEAITMKGTGLAEVAVNAIKKGPLWVPGKQNGRSVNSYVIAPVTFKLSDNLGIKNEPE